MREAYGYFDVDGTEYTPRPMAASQWSADQVVGPALCGLLAGAIENEHGTDGFVPVRLTVDLFKPARMRQLTVSTTRVRDGKRIRLADAVLGQGEDPVARASVVLLRPSQEPPGAIWKRAAQPVPPPADLAGPDGVPAPPLWGSDDSGWSSSVSEHEDDSRKRSWQSPPPAVAGVAATPFVRAAMAAEQTSMVTNWGDAGIGFINTDLTVGFSRLPIGTWIGLEADNHLSERGLAVGTATLFDRHGSFGTAMITAVANAARQISAARIDGVIAAASQSSS
ncbi:acyl-CoA thioesterase domain-containing protein [Nocardia pseudobrasiliensis]|uniref:Thioesterase superfamily protein n=1 Tax=Nocardia pseudobrasiliensis TaxID=45979 RepID=A0A370ICI3_9NOCA|nr:acyl-CoA thioesterase domain-containing protein [Nocardia pseudobrasiliensis]RDI67791.1 thioesterase superfamily protein [Nocardia pseudobrasiliensis]